MKKICANRWCLESFEITDADRDLLDRLAPVIGGRKISIPEPTLCPPCRSQRRLTGRNERNLYRRTDSITGKDIISIHSPEKRYPVTEPEIWYSDRFDSMEYGMPFDPQRSFFDQFAELQQRVPRMSLGVIKNENCPYVNQVWNCKDCYMSFDMGFSEDILYGTGVYHSQDLNDCSFTRESSLSYSLADCSKCYHCAGLQDCSDCSGAYFSVDCAQCRDIAFCTNLRGKQYCYRNEQLSKEQWEKVLRELNLGSASKWRDHDAAFMALLSTVLRRDTHNIQCEDCTGDYLLHSRNCQSCFDCDKSEDLHYCTRIDEQVVTSMDVDHASLAELVYEGLTIAGHNILFSQNSYSPGNTNILYCDLIISSSDCFGCVGIKNKKHCILNKQYTREEYEELVPRIIEHMRKTPLRLPDGSSAGQEWGEGFPLEKSLFTYNESAAQEFFPLTKEQVLDRGWRWRDQVDDMPKVARIIPANRLPDSINDVSDDILQSAIECEITKRPFRIIKQELDFYRNMGLPLPRMHPDERHRRRMALRNPRKLWHRECGKCGKGIETSYAPERLEKIYCEECYLKEVY